MKKYYISCTGDTPMASYSKDFYEWVLKEKGYVFLDSAQHHVNILSKVASRDKVHIEIDGSQSKSIHLLYLMLKTRYHHVSVTLHDPQSVRLSFNMHRNPVLQGLARIYGYLSRSGASENLFSRINMIYVLSGKDIEPVKKRYRTNQVHYLPYVISDEEIHRRSFQDDSPIFPGQGGREKEIARFNRLHGQLIGHAQLIGRGQADYLAGQYVGSRNFSHDTEEMFFSGFGARAGSVAPDGRHSWGAMQKDGEMVHRFVSNAGLLDQVRRDRYNYLMDHHSAEAVSKLYKD